MSFLRLIAAEWRLIMAPSSRHFVLLLLLFALVLPSSAYFLLPDQPTDLMQVNLSLVTEEEHPLLEYTVEELRKHSLVNRVYVDNLAGAQEHLAQGQVVAYLKFPANFFATVGNISQREQVHLVLNPDMKLEGEMLAKFFDAVSQTFVRGSSSYYAYYELAQPFFISSHLISAHFTQKMMQMVSRIFMGTELDTIEDYPRFNMEAHVMASFFVIMAVFSAFLPLIFTLRDEGNGLSARFLSLGFQRWELLASHLICALPFLILTSIPVGALAILAFDFPLGLRHGLLILLLYLSSASLLLALHNLWPRLGQTMLQLSYWLVLAQLLVGGVIYPNDLLPPPVRAVAQLAAPAPAHAGLFLDFAQAPSASQYWQLLGLSLLALALLSLAQARRTRRNLL